MVETSKIDLRKDIVNKIATAKGLGSQKAQVALVLDYSGSMDPLYKNGFVQRLVERLVPLAMQFDDNGEMELYIFQNNCQKHKNNITLANFDGFVNREVYGKYNFGGTYYAPAFKMITEEYAPTQSKGFFGFGKSSPSKDPAYVIFITDGDNSDRENSTKQIIEASKSPIFFQFVGIGNASFSYLDQLDTMKGRACDNANFFQANDLEKMSDEELYNSLLSEFPSYINEARKLGILAK